MNRRVAQALHNATVKSGLASSSTGGAVRILGVDPGSRRTGYGCIECVGNRVKPIGFGTLKLSTVSGRSVVPLEERLYSLYVGLSTVIEQTRPSILAVEKVFFAKNALSALKLGQARGVVLLAGRAHGLSLREYNPTQVKQAVVGYGQADKDQIAQMVRLIVGVKDFPTHDASDALAIALCSFYLGESPKPVETLSAADPTSPGRMGSGSPFGFNRTATPASSRNRRRLTLAESLGLCTTSNGPANGRTGRGRKS